MRIVQTLTHSLLFLVSLTVIAVASFASDISGPSEATGSILVYPYYTSTTANGWDTRITIANTDPYRVEGLPADPVRTAYVHMFLIDGSSCYQADQFVCLTPNAAITFLASRLDPDVTGYIIAVAVDENGNLTRQNSLVGDAFVSEGNYVGNYGAEAFRAYGNPGIAGDGVAYFGGRPTGLPLINSYDYAPIRFATTVQSPADAPGQRFVTSSIGGDTTSGTVSGAGQVGVGYIYNGYERPFGSFSNFHVGGCQAISVLGVNAPRVPYGVARLIPPGQIGTITIPTGPAVGLIMTPQGSNRWSGIRGLHKTRVAKAGLVVPSFMPAC